VIAQNLSGSVVTVAFTADHPGGGQIDNEYEIFSSTYLSNLLSDGFESGDLSAWTVSP
jgi:hypothetical protein